MAMHKRQAPRDVRRPKVAGLPKRQEVKHLKSDRSTAAQPSKPSSAMASSQVIKMSSGTAASCRNSKLATSASRRNRKVASSTQAKLETAGDATELDEIFATLAPKRAVRDEARRQQSQQLEEACDLQRARKRAGKNVLVDPVFGEAYDLDRAIDPQNAKVHRFDHISGFRVFKAHDLGLGRGGGTPLCPFDCNCCF
mmetsp:Transcript_36586/g.60602  ORF Transcript_36586/g.60602 Transcript_36586/m.60602 type:complete len:197 (+) Transcript_36586:55-645(+)